jgi:hypothetical protein
MHLHKHAGEEGHGPGLAAMRGNASALQAASQLAMFGKSARSQQPLLYEKYSNNFLGLTG